MRVKHTLLNVTAGLGNQLIITALSFISRTVFIHSLGLEYLGINALFTSMLAMLSIVEAGIGSSIVYNLYKPVAENNRPKIQALMKLYRNAYMIIALIVFGLGLCVMPFLDMFVQDTSVGQLNLIFLLFLVNTAAPYLFIYKHSFLNVNQRSYIVTNVFSVSTIISTCLKIGILYYTQNYILFLLVESVIMIGTSMLLAIMVDRMYPYLKEKVKTALDPETRATFMKNMKAILLQKSGNYFVFGVDSVLISAFVGVAAVGLYSNYKMLMDIARTFINQVFDNMYHSFGNLVAEGTAAKIYSVYKAAMLLNFWLYSLLSIVLYIVIEPFIELWIGSQFVMGPVVLLALILLFYERGMRNSITTVKTTAGIFHEDRYAPLGQAVINLSCSIVLVKLFGLTGIFFGTLISALTVPFWLTPYLVYKKVFTVPVHKYFIQYLRYTAIGLAAFFAAQAASAWLPAQHFLWIGLKGLVVLVIVNSIYIAVFYRSSEFQYLRGIAHALIEKLPYVHFILKKQEAVDKEAKSTSQGG